MNRDQWLAAIREAEQAEETERDAITVNEYATMANCGRDLARRRLEDLCARGLARRVTKRLRDRIGKPQLRPAYRLVEPVPADTQIEG